jgi:hypothetical protein
VRFYNHCLILPSFDEEYFEAGNNVVACGSCGRFSWERRVFLSSGE